MTLGALVDWPTGHDLATYMAKRGQSNAAADADLFDLVEDVCELVAGLCDIAYTDTAGAATQISKRQRRAILMQSHRVYRRKDSPEGVVGFGPDQAIRISKLDPDIQDFLVPDVTIRVGAP